MVRGECQRGPMKRQLVHTKLSTRDVEDLTACLARLDQIHDSINATGLAGKLALMHLCVEVYRVIETLLRKEMGQVQRWQAKEAPPPANDETREDE